MGTKSFGTKTITGKEGDMVLSYKKTQVLPWGEINFFTKVLGAIK